MGHRQVRDRIARIEELNRLHKKNPDWDDQRCVDELCIRTGIRPFTATQYLELLKRTKRWA